MIDPVVDANLDARRLYILLHSASAVWVGCSGFRDDDAASKGGVMMMVHARCLSETLFSVV